MASIDKVVVIGAGVMGAGIAAHLANAGLSVVLLDTAEEGPRRSRRARRPDPSHVTPDLIRGPASFLATEKKRDAGSSPA